MTWRSAGLPAAPLLSVCCWLTAHQSRCATRRSAAHGGCSEDRRHRVCYHVPSTQTGGHARDLGAMIVHVAAAALTVDRCAGEAGDSPRRGRTPTAAATVGLLWAAKIGNGREVVWSVNVVCAIPAGARR